MNRSRPQVLRVATLAIAFTLMTAACSPPRNLATGLNGYSTDIVMGSQAKPEPPPALIPQAEIAPTFPGFIVAPPPPPASVARVQETEVAAPPTTAPVVDFPQPTDACPQASLFDVPTPASAQVVGVPKEGVYPYRQIGRLMDKGKEPVPLPDLSERIITNLRTKTDGTFSHDVIISQFGDTTTNSYEFIKTSGQSDVDGIYLTRTVRKTAAGVNEEFTPTGAQGTNLGLRLLPIPATQGKTWRSVASDPARGTSMTLEGIIRERSRVDACGVVVEGWAAEVKVEIRIVGKIDAIVITATYLLATHLGALMIGDSVKRVVSESGQPIQTTDTASLINRLVPTGPKPA